jgi:tRNA-modifying protein YgfZ
MDTPKNTFPPYPALPTGAALLQHLGIIQIDGADAVRFIHGMLTQDFVLLDLEHARLAALCSPKGRMLASFIGYKDANGSVFLLCHRDLIEATIKRLSMFVLRAKASLRNASTEYSVFGVFGTNASEPWSKTQDATGIVYIGLHPVVGYARALAIAPVGATTAITPNLHEQFWRWSEVRSGVATVCTAVADQLVPQMLNYESIGGVNFKKGCYPGQEVVARSQFRGTIKRRGYIVHGEAVMQAGDLVYSAEDHEQPAGLVVQAAAAPAGGYDAIISCQVAVAEKDQLRLSEALGAPLHLRPLGYALLDDV